MILKQGLQEIILKTAPTSAGTIVQDFSIQSDAALLLLWVNSVAGNILVEIYGILDNSNKEVLLLSFPLVTSASTEVLQKRTGTAPTRLRAKVIHSGACDFELSARAVATGSSDTRILGGSSLKMSQKTISTTPSLIIAASLVDRTAVAIKNWSTNGTLYVAETAAKANSTVGWPIGPKDALGLDIQAGVEIYAISSQGTCDVRIIESGG